MAPPNTIFPPLGEVSGIFPRYPTPATSSSFFVPSIPLLENSTRLTTYAGSLPARPGAADNAYLYFLLLKARHTTGNKRKLIIWFNGGPGCSSFDGSMMEIGAWKPDGKGGLKWAKQGGAWNEYADVLFLDQPVGTGFSYVNTNAYVKSIPQAADEVLHFLRRFVEVFPEFARGNGADVYLAGESFAGQYIPYTAEAIRKAGRSSPVDLVGLAIGNGFIDPKSQYGSELDMLVKAGVWQTSSEEYKKAKALSDECQRIIKDTKGNPRHIGRCESVLSNIQELSKTKVDGKDMCINIYDVRLSDSYPACGMHWPTTLSATYEYLKRPDVRRAFHVDEQSKPEAWVECSNRVHTSLTDGSTTQAAVELLPGLLKSGIEVLLFAGDQDLICNHIGVERLVENLNWLGSKGFSTSSTEQEWFVNNSLAGSWRSERGLTYVKVAGASHMVGVDVPVESHDMMLRFMKIDLLGVAGPNGRISSRVGEAADRQLLVGGGGAVDDRPMIPGIDGKSEEQVAEQAKWAAYYNAGSAALVFLLLAVSIGVFVLLRLRRKARLSNQGVRLGNMGMNRSDVIDDEHHELEHLVEEPEEEEEEDGEERNNRDGNRWSDGTYRQGDRNLSNLGNGNGNGNDGSGSSRQGLKGNEEIFDVGNESDESEGRR